MNGNFVYLWREWCLLNGHVKFFLLTEWLKIMLVYLYTVRTMAHSCTTYGEPLREWTQSGKLETRYLLNPFMSAVS